MTTEIPSSEPAVLKPAVRPRSAVNSSASHRSQVDKMREHFAAQKKVRVRIRPEDGEQWVEVNGYTYLIQPGEFVKVPEQIYEMLVEAGVA